MEGWIVLLWILSPIALAAGSVAAAVVVGAGNRIGAKGTGRPRLTRRVREAGRDVGADCHPPRPATIADTEAVNKRERKASYCERLRTGCPLPVLGEQPVRQLRRPRHGEGHRAAAPIVPGGGAKIIRQLCLTMTPITNIAAGILIANDRYAELPLFLLASIALAFLVVSLEGRDRDRESPVTDTRDAETPHPLLGRKTC